MNGRLGWNSGLLQFALKAEEDGAFSYEETTNSPEAAGYPEFPCFDLRPYLAIVMAMMSAADHMPLAEVKNRLSEVVERLEREHGRVVITKHGRPAAVVLNVDDLEGLEETLGVLSDAKLRRRIRKAEAEINAGDAEELTKDEALALIKRRR